MSTPKKKNQALRKEVSLKLLLHLKNNYADGGQIVRFSTKLSGLDISRNILRGQLLSELLVIFQHLGFTMEPLVIDDASTVGELRDAIVNRVSVLSFVSIRNKVYASIKSAAKKEGHPIEEIVGGRAFTVSPHNFTRYGKIASEVESTIMPFLKIDVTAAQVKEARTPMQLAKFIFDQFPTSRQV